MRKFLLLLILPVSLTLTACSTLLDNLPGVYSVEIQQGNMVDQDMINQLRPSMTKRQVLYIMGSPMLVDVFHQKRWDYLYSKQLDGEAREQKKITLFFDGDLLSGIQGDFKPDSQTVKVVKETTVDVPVRDLEKTLWEKVVWLFSNDPEPRINYNKADTTEKIAVTEPNPLDKKLTTHPKNRVSPLVQDETKVGTQASQIAKSVANDTNTEKNLGEMVGEFVNDVVWKKVAWLFNDESENNLAADTPASSVAEKDLSEAERSVNQSLVTTKAPNSDLKATDPIDTQRFSFLKGM
jgi:outer membrane protein assembly factor BamE